MNKIEKLGRTWIDSSPKLIKLEDVRDGRGDTKVVFPLNNPVELVIWVGSADKPYKGIAATIDTVAIVLSLI